MKKMALLSTSAEASLVKLNGINDKIVACVQRCVCLQCCCSCVCVCVCVCVCLLAARDVIYHFAAPMHQSTVSSSPVIRGIFVAALRQTI